MINKKKILDIGCGERKIPGSIGLDVAKLKGVDVVHDINKGLPFKDNTFDEIHCYHVLEHVDDLIFTMEEMWRICKPGATVFIRVPSFANKMAFQDPTHKNFFGIDTFNYFDQNDRFGYYSKADFKIVNKKMIWLLYPERTRWFMQPFAWFVHSIEKIVNYSQRTQTWFEKRSFLFNGWNNLCFELVAKK